MSVWDNIIIPQVRNIATSLSLSVQGFKRRIALSQCQENSSEEHEIETDLLIPFPHVRSHFSGCKLHGHLLELPLLLCQSFWRCVCVCVCVARGRHKIVRAIRWERQDGETETAMERGRESRSIGMMASLGKAARLRGALMTAGTRQRIRRPEECDN